MKFWLRNYGVGRITGVSCSALAEIGLEVGEHPLCFSWSTERYVSVKHLRPPHCAYAMPYWHGGPG